MNTAIYSERQEIGGENAMITTKAKVGMKQRPALSLINKNALHDNVVSKNKTVPMKKEISQNRLPQKVKIVERSHQIHKTLSREDEMSELKDVAFAPIFRERNDIASNRGFETTLQHANPIHEQAKVLIHEDCREESSTLELFEDQRIDAADLFSANQKRFGQSKVIEEKRTSQFLEAPNEDFFSEEMERLLCIELANPIGELDSDSEGENDFS
jgi:hypothetical protein